MQQKNAYAKAGVDIDAGRQATELMKRAVRATFGPEVLSDVGSFGGLFDLSRIQRMAHPVLVASTDGVGTKTKVAWQAAKWDSIGADIVNHCVNDILVQGAQPLFFLDYVASAKLDPAQIATIVGGAAAACQAVGCALLGGETAEMPGVYAPGAVDLVGTIIGVVERDSIIDGRRIRPGDTILALPSSGLHTNGFTLARAALAGLDWTIPQQKLAGRTLAEALLEPHQAYLEPVKRLWEAGVDIRGMAHITGGGLVDNPPRVFPAGVGAVIRRNRWTVPPLFQMIQQAGDIKDAEMFRVFNMGLGMLIVVPPEHGNLAEEALSGQILKVGELVAGEQVVQFTGA